MNGQSRLAAALPTSVIDHATEHDVVMRGRYTLDATTMRERLVSGMLAADPALICPDPAAHHHRERCHNYDPDSIIAHLHSVIDGQAVCPDPADHELAAAVREQSNRLLQLLEAAYRMEHELSRGYGHVKDFEDCGSHDCPGRRRILASFEPITAALEDKP